MDIIWLVIYFGLAGVSQGIIKYFKDLFANREGSTARTVSQLWENSPDDNDVWSVSNAYTYYIQNLPSGAYSLLSVLHGMVSLHSRRRPKES